MLNIRYEKEVEKLLTEKEKKNRTSFQNFFLGSQAIKLSNTKIAKKYYWKAIKINTNKKAIISYILSFLGVKTVLKSRYYLNKIRFKNNHE